jgi:hypothetical protein
MTMAKNRRKRIQTSTKKERRRKRRKKEKMKKSKRHASATNVAELSVPPTPFVEAAGRGVPSHRARLHLVMMLLLPLGTVDSRTAPRGGNPLSRGDLQALFSAALQDPKSSAKKLKLSNSVKYNTLNSRS